MDGVKIDNMNEPKIVGRIGEDFTSVIEELSKEMANDIERGVHIMGAGQFGGNVSLLLVERSMPICAHDFGRTTTVERGITITDEIPTLKLTDDYFKGDDYKIDMNEPGHPFDKFISGNHKRKGKKK